MTPADLAVLIRATTADVLARRGLGTGTLPAEIELVRPSDPANGDYMTTVALRTAPALGVPAREMAGWLAAALAGRAGISTAEVAGPGFVNMRLTSPGALIAAVLAAGERDPRFDVPADREVRVGGGGTRTFDGLAAEVGPDTARYALLRAPAGREPVLDLDVLAGNTDANPAYRVRYAHARLCALARNAADLGIERGERYELLRHPREVELIGVIGDFGGVVAVGVARDEPHRVTRNLEELADAFARFDGCARVLPMGDEPVTDAHRARLALCAAIRRVLAGGLALLGVSAPERM